jgi:xanthine dehydrogenase molybdopterin-binding subunit B
VNVGAQYHFHMETQTAYAVPQEDGGLQLYSATQGPDFVTRCVSTATGLPANKIRVELRRMGGAYGGKITRAMLPAVACSVAAMVTGLPVRTQVVICLFFMLGCS